MNGIIPLNKEIGQTSSDYVYQLRKILHTRKIGHTGTLDPLVNGVLPICVGQSTKLVNRLTGTPKEYEGEVTLGISTTTEDREGDIVEETKLTKPISKEQIINVLNEMVGQLVQIPPMYSAVRVNGKKLYEYARAGIEVKRPERTINIYELNLLGEPEFDENTGREKFKFHVKCSKGTYVRTLAVQMGLDLGLPAYMSQLTRTKSAGFSLDETFTIDQIKELMENGQNDFLKSTDEVLSYIPAHELSDYEWEVKVEHGGFLDLADADQSKELRVTRNKITKAIYKFDIERGTWVPETMLLGNE